MSSTSGRSGKPALTPRKSALSSSSSGATRTGSADAADVVGPAPVNDPLSPSFNPSRLKVAELRSLLFQHDVHPPSSARKPALIEAYEEHVRGNADELRATRNRDLNVRPDERGIVFLGNGQVQRSPSASAGPSTDGEGADSSHDDSAHVRRARGRRSVSWAASVDSADEAGSAEPEPDISSSVNISTFSMENPFQSKPSSPSATPSARKKAPRASEPAKQAAGAPSARKRTAAARQSLPATRAKKETRSTDDSDDGGEADVSTQSYADDSLASPLVQKQKRMRQWVDHGKEGREKDAKSETGTDGGALSGLLSLALLIAAAAWWIWYTQESKALGFCDTSSHTNALIKTRAVDRQRHFEQRRNDNVSDAVASLRIPDLVRPSCTSCPVHARCSAGELLGCESTDYVQRVPFAAHIPVARALLPLSSVAPTCEPDEEKLLLAADLADEIEGRLRTWKADVYCNRQRARLGPRDEPDWGAEGVYALPLSDVYHDLKTAAERGTVLRSQSNDFFRALWHLAMADLEASGRVQQRSARLLATRSALGVGLTCRLRRATSSVWRTLRFWLFGLGAVAVTLQWLRWRMRGTSRVQKKAVELVDVALRALQTAKQRHASLGGGGGVEPYVSITQLRDSVLRRHDGSMNDAARKTLWSRVSSLVEANTNVRTRQARVQGEWARVWEWVGPATLLDHQPSSQSGREMTQAQRGTVKTSPVVQQDASGRWGSAAQASSPQQQDYNAGPERETSASV